MTEIRVSKDILKQAALYGLKTDTYKTLIEMVKFSAPFTHHRGNRRYENFVFDVRDNELKEIYLMTGKDDPVYNSRKALCPDCGGDGDWCLTCNSTGYIIEW